jgi:hypothetical protein
MPGVRNERSVRTDVRYPKEENRQDEENREDMEAVK